MVACAFSDAENGELGQKHPALRFSEGWARKSKKMCGLKGSCEARLR